MDEQASRQSEYNALQDVGPASTAAIFNARLDADSRLHSISLSTDGKIKSITRQSERLNEFTDQVYDAAGGLVAPSMCHAHVHLDKCFLIQDPKYSDLKITTGTFQEAMELTRAAKQRFTEEDVLRRGRLLIRESLEAGVTSMRAFIELDECAELLPLQSASRLKRECEAFCTIQICAFAQLPLFHEKSKGGANGMKETHEKRQRLLEEALQMPGVEVVGTTPYVEADSDSVERNIDLAIQLALKYQKHVDFHLDYNIDPLGRATLYGVIDGLKRVDWTTRTSRKITIGHCTRLTRFAAEDWDNLRQRIGDLPMSFVGLPTSDLFMMGRPDASSTPDERPRGTLQIPRMIQDHGCSGCISINNVGNAFTPYGNCDPLSIAHLGIGMYQNATEEGTALLYRCVSSMARSSIGMADHDVVKGHDADLVIFHPTSTYRPRPCTTSDLVYSPDTKREVFFRGSRVMFEKRVS